jgi:hypothetical protein
MLTTASLLSVLFFSFHLADDIVRGMEPGTLTNLTAVPIFVFWLYGTLVLAERRSGYIITLLGGLFSLVVPVVHMSGKGVGISSSIGNSSGHFFFVWTLIAIGVTGVFSSILSARGLWSLRRGQSRESKPIPTT